MTLFRTVLMSGFVLALCAGAAQAQDAPAGRATGKPMMTLQMPALPDPVRVTLDPKTTALLVLDYVEDICNTQAKCKGQMLPAMTPFMARVRKAGLVVAYGTRAQNMTKWLPEVAPAPGDIKIVNTAQDRFYGTDLDKELKAKGIKTIIMVGWKVSGSVTYTSVGAMAHDYTVVLPMDTTTAATDYETTIGFYNVLNSGNANLANQPLKPKATTLTRTDMIAFQ
ncbi:MAG TPA: isochorismatase family protein [Micropepsaceae bacterium]|nr:isochorismatase family protein [Micropepsaceae bacterium]